MESLVKEIERHNKLYWEKSKPEISDEEYDLLVNKLKTIDPNHHILTSLDTQKSTETQGKYFHKDKMLSLEKYTSKEKAFKRMEEIARTKDEVFRFELKLDGMSAKIENEHLGSRGDGEYGEDHTDKIGYISYFADKAITPFTLPDFCIGELIITDKFFEENLKGDLTDKNYKNSRNACAGIMGNKKAEKIIGKGITFVDYNWSPITRKTTIENLKEKWDEWVAEFKSLGLPYDGLVIKLDDQDYYKKLGNKTNYPRGAFAYKFANKKAITDVKSITPQVSRTGKLTPVAELKSIELAGVTIKRATCHNYDFVMKMGVGHGSSVVVERAGDVIPKITGVVAGKIDYLDPDHPDMEYFEHAVNIPSMCPCCKSEVETKGVDLVCPNDECPDRLIENLVFMAKVIGIEELGRPTAEKILSNPKLEIKQIQHFNRISLEDLEQLEGYGEKSAKTLYDNIQTSLKNITIVQFLTTFGIPNVGKTILTKILDDLKGFKNLYGVQDVNRLLSIDGVGKVLVKNLIRGFKEKEIVKAYKDYLVYIGPIKEKDYDVVEEVKKTICFTGKMPEKRSVYEKMAKANGYEPASVDKNLDVLVVDDMDSTSGKMKKAKKNGTKIMTIDEWLDIIK